MRTPRLIGFLLLTLSCAAPAVSADSSWTAPPSLTEAPLPAIEERIPWGFNLHGGDVGYDLDAADAAFAEIAALGGSLVRTDFSWSRLEPEPGVWDEEFFAFFDGYVDRAAAQGIEVICIFSHPPQWAMSLYRLGYKEEFLRRYEAYCREVAQRMGDRLYYYQIWNEANHPLVDPIAREDDWLLYLAGDRGVRIDGDPNDYRCMINVLAQAPFWDIDLTYYLSQLDAADPANTVTLIGLDHYPGTWTLTPDWDWLPLLRLMRMLADPGHPAYGRDGAVMETGYSTWGRWLHNELSQLTWIDSSLPVLRFLLHAFNATQPARFEFAIWYELFDADSSSYPLDIEAHFGILHTDGSPKTAYPALREQIAEF
jgi:hypothetical protein